MGKIRDFFRDLFWVDDNNQIKKEDWEEIGDDFNGEKRKDTGEHNPEPVIDGSGDNPNTNT